MSAILGEIVRLWGHSRRSDPPHIVAFYIRHPDTVRCSVALDRHGTLIGFQSLKRVGEANAYDVTPGWGVIGSYVKPDHAGQGVGRALFAASLRAARGAGLPFIDASIAADNRAGLAYYDAMGFRTYRERNGLVCKRFDVSGTRQHSN